MRYEIVQQHEYQDIYRLESGVILEVNKFEWGRYDSFYRIDKKKIEKVKGMKNCFRFKENYLNYKVGDIFYHNQIIKPTTDYKKYNVELRLSGAYKGSIEDHFQLYEQIKEILNTYIK